MPVFPRIYLYRRVLSAKRYIEENYHLPINLDEISGEAAFSKFHFVRIFKMAYGKTPHRFLTGLRIDKAKLLLQTGMPVSGVCFSVGFESVSTFTTLFRRFVLQTPAKYQQLQLARKMQMKVSPLKFIPGCFVQKIGWAKNSNFQ
ncbi:helix-turn-helix domain-containing protein [Hufsiella ginkgonis]|uniref:Helix-turn-helix domain-containing protein n=1 Tax=Hufsiella ginkgonis TaxID=2695274 RepID=A0A7K1XWZ8_9SPHI|nr:AraC family transcriptional regulator [Hufsiella ginkgonis]MXV15357.1 helix-turn-helix domain-containing protein [Hufsiella ginkgonis]